MDVYLLLGANLGERSATVMKARELIHLLIGPVTRVSALYETAPWGVTDQPSFLNQVLVTETDMSPQRVLDQIQTIEQNLGRIRYDKWGARVIDIDILYYSQYVFQSDRLAIPHPYLHQRRFTLVPLCEIAPDFVHPLLAKTNLTLLAECKDQGQVVKLDD
ncbi:2-amino-4-hydroxy-6-hydroxymethyldihydropteridine diphosphokinase [Nibrella saemangeumensis]|uniref:2-amino-4-hydroxy-6-hydroxymethyldihydropteridine pyrophosphokinase n=1 Tax=Nibrella saemangeumensis TaxID=1084526 RepID=A0ABP8MUE0_9BACT